MYYVQVRRLELSSFCVSSWQSLSATLMLLYSLPAGPPEEAGSLPARWQDMSAATRKSHNINYVLWCCANSRPFSMARDTGFTLFAGGMDAKYAVKTISNTTITNTVNEEYEKLRDSMIGELRLAKEKFAPDNGPFCCAQLDLTTAQNISFITFSVTFMDASFELRRYGLATKACFGTHTAQDIESCIREVRTSAYLVLCD